MDTKKKLAMVAVPVMSALSSVPALAADPATANAALTDGATNAVAQVTANINAVVPIALGLLGVVMAIKIGIRVFKSVTKSSAS